jgi:hypothetical protein
MQAGRQAWWARVEAWLYATAQAQGTIEYGLILAWVGLLLIVAVLALGPRVAELFGASAGSSPSPVPFPMLWAPAR